MSWNRYASKRRMKFRPSPLQRSVPLDPRLRGVLAREMARDESARVTGHGCAYKITTSLSAIR